MVCEIVRKLSIKSYIKCFYVLLLTAKELLQLLDVYCRETYILITSVTAMPRCEGLPTGHCPKKVNNRTIKNSICDLFLCPSCEATRFPPRPQAASSVEKCATNENNKHSAADTHKESAAAVTVATVTSLPVSDATDHTNASDDENGRSSCYNRKSDVRLRSTDNVQHDCCAACHVAIEQLRTANSDILQTVATLREEIKQLRLEFEFYRLSHPEPPVSWPQRPSDPTVESLAAVHSELTEGTTQAKCSCYGNEGARGRGRRRCFLRIM